MEIMFKNPFHLAIVSKDCLKKSAILFLTIFVASTLIEECSDV